MRKNQLQSLLALLLALVLALGSTSALAAITPGQTISSDSKWMWMQDGYATEAAAEAALKSKLGIS